jgi:hypothetical protein
LHQKTVESNQIQNKDIEVLLSNLFRSQYQINGLDYDQVDFSDRTIIIDDFHLLVDISNCNQILENLLKIAPRVFITTSMEDFSKKLLFSSDNLNTFSKLDLFKIEEFGYIRRNLLIKKWVELGNSMKKQEIIEKSDELEKNINDIISIKAVPSYPMYILTLLQAAETNTSIAETAFVHYFEYLISKSMEKSIKKKDVDGVKNYARKLAFFFYEKAIYKISEKEFHVFHENHNEAFLTRISFLDITKSLIDAQILWFEKNEGVGEYRFKYKYCYYYFAALEIISRNTHHEANQYRSIIQNLCKNLYLDENLNLLMFIVMNIKDKFVFDELLLNAQILYESEEELDLIEDTRQIDELSVDIQELVLPNTSVEANKAEIRERNDLNHGNDEKINQLTQEKAKENKSVQEYIMSLRTLQILGSILKTYSGSLEASLKKDIGNEVFSLPQRVLKFLFRNIAENKGNLLDYINERIVCSELRKLPKEQQENMRERYEKKEIPIAYIDRQHIAKKLVFGLYSFFHFILIKATSSHVSEYSLDPLFKQIEETRKDSKGNFSINDRLLLLSMLLEYKKNIPEKIVKELEKDLKNNPIGYSTLRNLVLHFMYLHDVPWKQRQQICELLKISMAGEQKMILKNQTRKMRGK